MATQFYLQLATARLPATALLLPRRPLTWQRAAIATSVGAGALLLAWAYAKWLMRCACRHATLLQLARLFPLAAPSTILIAGCNVLQVQYDNQNEGTV